MMNTINPTAAAITAMGAGALAKRNAALEARVKELEGALRELSKTLEPWLTTADAGLPAVIKTIGDCSDLHMAQRRARAVLAKEKADGG